MNIQEENSARYFRVQSEREQTLATDLHFGLRATLLVLNIDGCLVSTGYLELQ